MRITVATRRRPEQGQTIALVALSLVSLLGVAALAIDVSALYVARNEAQRAADAAALAGARIFATSSFASVPGSFGVPSEVCSSGGPGSTAAVNRQAEATAQENLISNQPATVTNITCSLYTGDPTRVQNPQVTVTVKQDNLQTFFSRMWSQANTSVSASATAEAYNASGQDVPVQVTGAKPWLLANCDENSTGAPQSAFCSAGGSNFYRTFINSDGTLTNNGSYLGNTIPLTKINPTANPPTMPTADNFYGLNFGTPAVACPAAGGCTLDGGYRDDIQCSSPVTLKCGDTIPGGAGVAIGTNNFSNRTRQAARCLIHSEGDDLKFDGQDIFHFPGAGTVPIRIEGGDDNPNPVLVGQQNISRSDSVVTVPVYDGHKLCTGAGNCPLTATIVGFMQLGIVRSCTSCSSMALPNDPNNCKCPVTPSVGTPQLQAIIMNAVGCKPGAISGNVSAQNSSPIAVRLIHQ